MLAALHYHALSVQFVMMFHVCRLVRIRMKSATHTKAPFALMVRKGNASSDSSL